MYPNDDLSEVVLPRKYRTLNSNIPSFKRDSPPEGSGSKECGGHLLTRQALHTYETANHVIHYKFNSYSGSCYDIPR